MDDVKDCVNFYGKSGCDINIKNSGTRGRYNCVKNGPCYFFKTNAQHEKEVAERKDAWERKTYKRLKKKFEEK